MDIGHYAGFSVSLDGPGIATVTFDQPDRLNGFTRGLKRDLIELLFQAQVDDAVRVVVFTGTGRAFSAGDDISTGTSGISDDATRVPPLPYGSPPAPLRSYDSLRTTSQMLNRAVRHLDKLTIAAINGFAIQSGLSLALACDFRIASSDARLGSATLRMGYLPDEGGHWLLVQMLGVAGAMDFLMRKRIVDAAHALELGLVHEVVQPQDLAERARALAQELAEGPQVAVRLLKRAIYSADELTFEQACDDIASKTAISDHHPDAEEGVAAFRQKRTPRFNQWLS
jgi:2-(1,2-epoxy-1,2-dihydrophenyl)acetyl-CoA isomerase